MDKRTSHRRTPAVDSATRDYDRIADAIELLCARGAATPTLEQLADHLDLSPAYTQRLFSRWAGVSPKRFAQLLGVEYVRRSLRETGSLLDAAIDAGLSGPGRLHDLMINIEAMTPAEYRAGGAGLIIRHGLGETPFGTATVAFTNRGICHLAFVDSGRGNDSDLAGQWPAAVIERDDAAADALLQKVFALPAEQATRGLSLWVRGTNFQVQVWRALLRIPSAGLLSYAQVAQLLGRPKATRSVATAIARNPVAYLIPCHRVLRGSGEFGEYHWGRQRKQAICAWEAARADPPD
jgi:AraC family transcriptional regulator of adaptative response/methylated-DNA-[protein]-cysteine methyltransferase